ncbi:hypothetical protein [Vreelandella subterranea]|nr:hypothetical protein [Halomonas subterranea]
MVLAVGRLEGVLVDFLNEKGVQVGEKIPLGGLIKKLESSGNLTDTVSYHLHFLLSQRNYFIHRITRLMHGYEIENSEMESFRNRVQSLREETELFASMFMKTQTTKNTEQGAPADR